MVSSRLINSIPVKVELKHRWLITASLLVIGLIVWLALNPNAWGGLQSSAHAATVFTVINTSDSGPGSLRQAIVDANANAGADTIAFNIPGAGIHTITPASALPAVTDAVVIDGYTQPGSSVNTLADGDNAVLLVELDGSNSGVPGGGLLVPGIRINASNSVVRGLVINRFPGEGISLAGSSVRLTGNLVEGNFIGTDSSGTLRRANSNGINVDFSSNTVIGGTTASARNVISGNSSNGILLNTRSSATTVQGNFIGTNASGTAALGNNSNGVFSGGDGNDIIGGTADGARNLISGNGSNAGIFVSADAVTIQGNLIGTDVTGTQALGNFFGVWLNQGDSGDTSIIGGITPGARNLISGNRGDGILLALTHNSQIQANLIGTDISGTKPLGNARDGISLDGFAAKNRIGGTAPGQGNTIAFNGRNGVFVMLSSNLVGNSIRGNAIFSNGALGIDLGDDGVTPNDSGDGDTGPNNLQNFPLITSVTSDNGQTTIAATLNSTPSTTFGLNFFVSSACDPSGNGEGTTPLSGSVAVITDAAGNGSVSATFPVTLSAGQVVTATATDPTGNTSEFSPCDSSQARGSVQFSTGSLKVIEDIGLLTVNVLRTGGSTGVMAVDYTTADISATAGSDYMPVSGTLIFNEGETSKSFDIPILDDAVTEPDESFVVRLSNAGNIDSLGTPNVELITLQDHGTPPVLSINNVNINEGNSGTTNAPFIVTLSPLTGRTVSVNYQTTGGNATSGVDYQPTSGTLTFGPKQTTQTIAVPVIGDTIDEFNETFQVLLTNASNATLANGGAPATGTIIDDDLPPAVSISDTVVVEGNSGATNAQFSLSLSQPSGKSTCVQASTADGTATAASGDYGQIGGGITNPPAFLMFNPGTVSATFSVGVRGDAQFEPNETFFANIIPCNGDITIGRGQAVATIINDDPQVPPSIAISDVAVSDANGATNAVFDVSLSAASTQAITVQYTTADGSATAGSDYQAASGTLTFAPGVTHQPVTVPIVPDSVAEGNETFFVNLSNSVGATFADTQGQGTISDGPPSQLPYLTINDITVVEGPSGTSNVDFIVTLSQASSQQVTFQFTTAPGTATENVDYMKVSGGGLLFGTTRFVISVPIVGDQLVETDETFFLNISNASGATIADNQGQATILNYVTPIVEFSSAGSTVAENAGTATVNVTRSGNSLTTSVVEFSSSDGLAQQRTDYTISAGSFKFLPGETSKSFSVPIVDDLYPEGDETINLTLSNPTGAMLGTTAGSIITIADDDSSPPNSNPLDNADGRFFVREHYYDFLNRGPDQGGFDFWSGKLTQCGNDATCLRNNRIDVSNQFFYVLEYQQTGAYVYRLYRAAYGNAQPFPNTDKGNETEAHKLPNYSVFANDRARVIGSASLAQSQLDLANAFVQRPEFLNRYPANLTGPGFVDSVLATIQNDLGVSLATQRNALITLFNSGGRGAVIYRLADDNLITNPIDNRALIDAEYNRSFVATQYFGYLRRNPDMGGFLFWLGVVNGASIRDLTRQRQMVCFFITSGEYQQRFSSVITHGNSECPQ